MKEELAYLLASTYHPKALVRIGLLCSDHTFDVAAVDITGTVHNTSLVCC